MCSDDNQNQDVDNDCYSDPTMAVAVHSVNDFKYYLLTLGFTILTMLTLKIVWRLTKCLSFNILKTVDDLSIEFKNRSLKQSSTSSTSSTNLKLNSKLVRVDSFQSNKLDAILFRNGNNISKRSSNSSLKSISLDEKEDSNNSVNITDIDVKLVRSDSDMSNAEKGFDIAKAACINTNTKSSQSQFQEKEKEKEKENKIHVFGFVFTYKKDV